MEKKKIVVFDIMLGEFFIKTMKLSVSTMSVFINDGNEIADAIDLAQIKEEVERRLPTLRNKKYNIIPVK